MLPDYYQRHRGTWSVAAYLEKHNPYMRREDKEELLNELCWLLTPRNPHKFMFLQEYLSEQYQDMLVERLGKDVEDEDES